MAEQILFNIIADVLTKLGSSSIQQIGSAFGVAKELTKLTKKLTTIKGVLVDAEKRQEESDAVKAWVRRLKDVVYDADDLLDDFATHQLQRGGVARQVSDFFSSSNQLVFRFKMSSKVKNIKEEVDEIVKEINLLKLVQGNIVQREVESSWRETHSFVLTSEIVGREENKEEIIKSLVSSDNQEILSMVAIVGIGGLGKTTLAQLVYNDEKVVQYFEPRIWVCVSDHFDVKSLVKKFLKEVCEQDVEWLELNGLKNLLHKKISQKRCLLVLDDVWNENPEKWDQLKSLLMVVGKGSKILVTTRHSKVASIMGINSPFFLEGLKDSLAWDLFSKIAFAEEPEKVHPKLVEMGKEIVNMCNGVPLVIKTLGAMLRLKTEESHWLSIKNNRNLLSLGAGNDNVLSVLKLSYNDLPIYLKQCFTYCALFLKDYKIEKNMLVQLWMAQGYIQPLDENVGHQYFEELLSRSLLEKFRNDAFNNILSCKMHDLMHDLAQSVVESEVLILEDDVKEIPKEVRHVSLFNSMNLKLKALRAKHIRTFLSIPIHGYKDDSIPNIYFSSFKCLRVLSLNGFKVKEVPKSLGKLSHLRYLDLSHNKFEVLPNSITRLKNLQTLKLIGCHVLKEMPKDMRQLINLRHWEYDGYLSMPCGIGKLTLLQSLPLFVVGNERGVGRLSELKGLNNLKGKLRIQKLENVRDAVDESDKANLREKKYIRMLALGWENRSAQSGRDAEKLMEGLHPPPSLEELRIGRYGGMGFPSWMRNGVLSQLKSLQLVDLSEVEYLGCSSEGPIFPCLENLFLIQMPKLKELWRRDTTHPPTSCPCLSHLQIQGCIVLASLELHSFPLLSKLEISGCPKLTSLLLPLSLDSPLSSLHIFECSDLASLNLHSYPLLSSLNISCCGELTSLLVPPSPLLSQFNISSCDKLASLELHSSLLSHLWIYDCPKLTSLLLPPSPRSELSILHCGDLAYLELPSLSQLCIEDCGHLASLKLSSSPLLSSLTISHCPELTTMQLSSLPCLKTLKLCNVRERVFRQLMLVTDSSLESLYMEGIHDMESLRRELLAHASTLQRLSITKCYGLATLPHWISSLTSLTELDIRDCKQIAERCRRETGQDWPQIAHIPEIYIKDGEE
eukprot:XP_019072860.1 PREDICTED: putative disease resistance protein RGA4 isoform X1 [Vitis vinifera]